VSGATYVWPLHGKFVDGARFDDTRTKCGVTRTYKPGECVGDTTAFGNLDYDYIYFDNAPNNLTRCRCSGRFATSTCTGAYEQLSPVSYCSRSCDATCTKEWSVVTTKVTFSAAARADTLGMLMALSVYAMVVAVTFWTSV
jgi:hypothetical protein